MSRVGRSPVYFQKTVQVSVSAENEIVVKGAKSAQKVKLHPAIKAKIEDGKIQLICEDHAATAHHGLIRALLQNAVTGVTTGWTRELELNGVGYRASVSGKKLELSLGYSHPISYAIPEGIEIKVDKQTKIAVTGADRAMVGQVAAQVRSFRPPEPYLGKGVKYSDERIRRKAGKAAGK
ncbi:MAG: 50S ribosomal protein L6 [Bdellovibrionales bacterium RBG_16_40_8]|nr:MAG: 50S ribosomal protein L6 [Bdellovibrionales bacterium RBG_16_40_8]